MWCFVPWWREKNTFCFFSAKKAQDVRWEVVRRLSCIFFPGRYVPAKSYFYIITTWKKKVQLSVSRNDNYDLKKKRYSLLHASNLREIVRFLREIECIEFECNAFVLVLVEIDRISYILNIQNVLVQLHLKLIQICYI